MEREMMSRKMYILFYNHLDINWARCTERAAKCNSIIQRSYFDIFHGIVDILPELCQRGLHYAEGQTVLYRLIQKRYPEQWKQLQQLIENGTVEVLKQGEVICDTNYAPAEGIARNYLLSEDFYREFCQNQWGPKLGFLWDAFGNNANMPQILKLAGAEVCGGTKYRQCLEHFWVGIDGTKLPCIDKIYGGYPTTGDPILYQLGRNAECPECHGIGCEKCGGEGVVISNPYEKEKVKAFLESTLEIENKKFILMGGEEMFPSDALVSAVEELNEKYAGKVVFSFEPFETFWNEYQDFYKGIAGSYTEPTPELNPVNAGCYVTRIVKKQRIRKIVYALIRAEAAIATNHWLNGYSSKPTEDMLLAWQDIALNLHHDAIGGAEIDSAYWEFMELLDEAESIANQYITVKNPFRACRIQTDRSRDGICHKQLGKMDVAYDLQGIVSVKKEGVDVFGEYRLTSLPYANPVSEPIRIGELVLQDDWGDEYGWNRLGYEFPMGHYNFQVYEDRDSIWWIGKRQVNDPCARILEWQIKAEASECGEYLKFTTDVNWDTTNKRLRVLFPVKDYNSLESIWEIPYGFLKRSFDPAAEHGPVYKGVTANPGYTFRSTTPAGEYPALHWVKHEIDADSGVAVLNKGIPSARWLPGCLSISLLRSPQLHEITILPHVQEMWDIDGMRDTGRHRFEYAVYPYIHGVTNGELTRIGYLYNEATPELPFQVDGDVVVTAFKEAQDGNGFILRVQEANGGKGYLSVQFAEERQVTVINLVEDKLEETVCAKEYSHTLYKHEILTLRIQ